MGLNQFLSFPPIPAGASGPQAPIDLAALVPPTGLDEKLTFIALGDFGSGYLAIEGSIDGVNWDVIGQWVVGQDADGIAGPNTEKLPITEEAFVNFIRINVGCDIRTTTQVTVAAQQNCDCATGGGGGSNCPILDVGDGVENSSTGGTEDIIYEEFVDFSPMAALGPSVLAYLTSIMRSLSGNPASLLRCRVGSSAPGVADGLVVGVLGTASIADDPVANFGVLIPNPAGAVLVQFTLQSSGPDTVFARGTHANFTCQLPV